MGTQDKKVAVAKIARGTSYETTVEVASTLNPTLTGSVTLSLPSGKDLARIAVIQHDLREGRPLEELDMLSGGTIVALSTLAVVVRKAPDWWYRTEGEGKLAVKIAAPELILDQHFIWDLWGRYVSFRDSFSDRAGNDGAGEPAVGAQPALARAAAAPAPV
jgi:hypothetical protein